MFLNISRNDKTWFTEYFVEIFQVFKENERKRKQYSSRSPQKHLRPQCLELIRKFAAKKFTLRRNTVHLGILSVFGILFSELFMISNDIHSCSNLPDGYIHGFS